MNLYFECQEQFDKHFLPPKQFREFSHAVKHDDILKAEQIVGARRWKAAISSNKGAATFIMCMAVEEGAEQMVKLLLTQKPWSSDHISTFVNIADDNMNMLKILVPYGGGVDRWGYFMHEVGHGRLEAFKIWSAHHMAPRWFLIELAMRGYDKVLEIFVSTMSDDLKRDALWESMLNNRSPCVSLLVTALVANGEREFQFPAHTCNNDEFSRLVRETISEYEQRLLSEHVRDRMVTDRRGRKM